MIRLGNTFSLPVLVLWLVLSSGCGGPRETEQEETPPSTTTPSELTRFDPIELQQDKQVVPSMYPQSGIIQGRRMDVDTDMQPVDLSDEGRSGTLEQIDTLSSQSFRVQIFAGKVYGEAQHEWIVAEEIFDRPVYLDYEVPYFKVRVGSFANRDTAELYLQRVKTAGYGNAWTVVVNVGVEELLPLSDPFPSMTGDTLRDK
ncbi:MAG: SPOR domain-containing protein [candidate division Zixibacteria bacterium]|nr:SPOR domain-containing protein [candidate division Zixibacteria bacterium]